MPVWWRADTVPCSTGAGCDLLVHEATFDATMEERAKDTGHSTTYATLGFMHTHTTLLPMWHSVMAGQFAARVQAKRLGITHFRSR